MQQAPKPGSAAETVATSVVPSLTGVERDILDFMVLYLRTHTYQPSIREIGEQCGIKSTKTVSEHLESLSEKGFLERDPARCRGVRIVGLDLAPQTMTVACYRDLEEAAGVGVAGARQPSRRLSIDRQLVGGKGTFMVQVRGEQLAAAGIDDGDFILVEPLLEEELSGGEILVAKVDGAPGYYRLRKSDSKMSLHPMEGSAIPEAKRGARGPRVVLVGRVCALYRRVGRLPMAAALTPH